ncbi:DUF6339 family protein [Polaribacter sp. KT 15]|uniref:DUF6339 family protein n=1 Tax=Polaribacter sp. KT 15 TaxID=1896175 RepID=UPI00090B09CD|nr:DUF6339 family protein [Polaribacter sp. KT 15]SHM75864.1 hypothetical protein SAMN05720268_0399 [Polaribacter sp. KT 15]
MEEKLYALKPEFVSELYDNWTSDYQDKTIKEFLSDIHRTYSNDLKKYCEPGDTGIYIDDEVLFHLNNPSSYFPSKSKWDLYSSKLLFDGNQNKFGIYRKDKNENRIPISIVQATDSRIWNYLSLFKLNNYVTERWGNSSDSIRMIIKNLSNVNISRHAILRIYWTAFLCYDKNRNDSLELLETMWYSEDFMTQVTERSTANMRTQIQWFLEFCSEPERENQIFKTKSIEGYSNYRKLIKLFLADSQIFTLSQSTKEDVYNLLEDSLEACYTHDLI